MNGSAQGLSPELIPFLFHYTEYWRKKYSDLKEY
nr:MAG TPA: hypothetical protein [Caudoviricetes sp.]